MISSRIFLSLLRFIEKFGFSFGFGQAYNPKKTGKQFAVWGKAMTLYVLICLSLSLAGVAGLQFFYLAYLERMDKELKKRLREVERHNYHLRQRLKDSELQIAEQAKLIEAVYEDSADEEEEIWADVIEDR
jgi:hypothetical protein